MLKIIPYSFTHVAVVEYMLNIYLKRTVIILSILIFIRYEFTGNIL